MFPSIPENCNESFVTVQVRGKNVCDVPPVAEKSPIFRCRCRQRVVIRCVQTDAIPTSSSWQRRRQTRKRPHSQLIQECSVAAVKSSDTSKFYDRINLPEKKTKKSDNHRSVITGSSSTNDSPVQIRSIKNGKVGWLKCEKKRAAHEKD